MPKIDPGLRRIVTSIVAARERGVPILAERVVDAGDAPNIMIELSGATIPRQLLDLDFKLRTRAGQVVTGQIPRAALEKLDGIPGLKRAEAPRPLVIDLDRALPDAGILPAAREVPFHRGENVIIGIVDHGIDYQHRAFRDDDGATRLLALWDQSLQPERDHEASPAPFGYGVTYTRDQINAALRSSRPLEQVRHRDTAPYHGTHVASIAAGRGQPPHPLTGARLFGVAPGADLIVVANTRSQRDNPGTVGDSADTLDAVAYILETAKALGPGRPVVINLSQGDNIGPHDGTSLLEVGIAALIKGPGRALIKSAGNEGGGGGHAHGVLVSGMPHDVLLAIPPGEIDVVVDLWYPPDDRISLTIEPPGIGVAATPTFTPGESRTVTLGARTEVFVDLEVDDPGNGHNRIYVALQPTDKNQGTLPPGLWKLRLEGSGAWHAWIQRNSGATFLPPFASQACTVTVPGTVDGVITVGSHVSRSMMRAGKLSKTSGRGPSRAGAPVPALTAPGEAILAAQPGDGFVAQKGTSMAAAMVTGAVALMLAIDPTLTAKKIREILQETARRDLHTGAVPNQEWGHGKLDILAACQLVTTRLSQS